MKSSDSVPSPRTPSMTGSAWVAHQVGEELGAITVELRSVNGRGLTVKQRLAPELSGCERRLEELVRGRISRGTVFVTVALDRPICADGAIDAARFAAAATALTRLASASGLPGPTVRDVLVVPGVLNASAGYRDVREGPTDEAPPELVVAFEKALEQLAVSRAEEGRALAVALGEHLDVLERGLETVARRAPELVGRHRERLLVRVREFLDTHGARLEPADVVQQVALFADKVDVTEEIARLRAHLDKARAMLEAGGVIGRNLEFLIQEMLREVNTIGSKSPDVEVSHEVVAMKSTIDRLKEQVANLE